MTRTLNLINVVTLLLATTLFGCKAYTSTTIYKSSKDINNSYWTLQSLNVDNCQCTELYIKHYTNDKIDFRIFLTDSLVRKTVYAPPKFSERKDVKVYIATDNNNFQIPLDSLDQEVFLTIWTLNKTDSNIKYKLKQKVIKGYIQDPKYK